MKGRGLCLRSKKENPYAYLAANQGLCIVYGATVWGEKLQNEGGMAIDYYCDRRADSICRLGDVPVVSCGDLERLIRENGKRAVILICVGINKRTVRSIYNDLLRLDIEADVFDYFENLYIFSDKNFWHKGKIYALYEHPYNCGYTEERMTERSVELALAMEWLGKCEGEVTEIGAVTPYYFYCDKIKDIIDPTDVHKRVNQRKSLFDADLKGGGGNILSISTVEHVGLSDYGMREEKNAPNAVEKILQESKKCLITAPLGYNPLLDEWVRDNRDNPMLSIMRRGINNRWSEMDIYSFSEIEYGPLWAEGLLIIEKE